MKTSHLEIPRSSKGSICLDVHAHRYVDEGFVIPGVGMYGIDPDGLIERLDRLFMFADRGHL